MDPQQPRASVFNKNRPIRLHDGEVQRSNCKGQGTICLAGYGPPGIFASAHIRCHSGLYVRVLAVRSNVCTFIISVSFCCRGATDVVGLNGNDTGILHPRLATSGVARCPPEGAKV